MIDPYSGLILDPGVIMEYLEESWRKEQDSKPINLNSRITAGLNKCPAQWVDGILIRFGRPIDGRKKDKVKDIAAYLTDPANLRAVVDSLPPDSRAALALVVNEGGWVKYGQLSRRFGDETGDEWWWNEGKLPTSPLGQLRSAGLLFVGKAGLGGRNYKVAVVPKELRKPLAEMLAAP